MNSYLVLFVSIILFTFQTVSSNLDVNDDKQDSEQLKTQNSDTIDNNFHRMVNRLPGTLLGRIGKNYNREDIETLRQVIRESPQNEWKQFTAPPVQQSNCIVEVQVTQKMAGKCTKLGGTIPACQAQDFVTIDYNSCK